MPLNPVQIRTQVRQLVTQLNSGDPVNDDPEQTIDTFTQGLTDIIVSAIQSADVTIPPGTVSQGVSPSVVVNPTPIVIIRALS